MAHVDWVKAELSKSITNLATSDQRRSLFKVQQRICGKLSNRVAYPVNVVGL